MLRKIYCDVCNGSGIQECPRCCGDGTDPDGSHCWYCDGLGDIACPCCGGIGSVEVEVDDELASMGW